MNFEEKMKELEEITNSLYSNNDNLEESLELYIKGIELYKECQDYLNEVKGEVKSIIDGKLVDCDIDIFEQ